MEGRLRDPVYRGHADFSLREIRIDRGRLLPQRPIDAWRLGRDDRIGMAPDPTTMYVVGLGLAVLAGASWYIRRRK